MVIGDRFAWAHIPKTGGDATLALFEAVIPDLIVEADSVNDRGKKHQGFEARDPEICRKPLLAANIRRLPSLQLSRTHHRFRHGSRPDYRPLPMASPEEVASSDGPDRLLRRYSCEGRLRIDVWLRLEHLREDFVAFVSRFRPLADEELTHARHAAPKKNIADYDHDVTHFFTRSQIERLYENNPLWASIEREVYGDLAIPEEALGRKPGDTEAWWEPFVRGPSR